MYFLNFKKSELGKNRKETILHLLTFHQHHKDVNIRVKPSVCYSSSRACNSDWCGKQRSWETYLTFIYDYVFKITLFLGCQPSFSFPYLSQIQENTLSWKKYGNRIHRNKEQLRKQLKATLFYMRHKAKYYKIQYLRNNIPDLQELQNDLSHNDQKFRS